MELMISTLDLQVEELGARTGTPADSPPSFLLERGRIRLVKPRAVCARFRYALGLKQRGLELGHLIVGITGSFQESGGHSRDPK